MSSLRRARVISKASVPLFNSQRTTGQVVEVPLEGPEDVQQVILLVVKTVKREYKNMIPKYFLYAIYSLLPY